MERKEMTSASTSRWRMKGLWIAILVAWGGVASAETITLAWDAVPEVCQAETPNPRCRSLPHRA